MSAAAWVFLFAAVANGLLLVCALLGAHEQQERAHRKRADMAARNLKLRNERDELAREVRRLSNIHLDGAAPVYDLYAKRHADFDQAANELASLDVFRADDWNHWGTGDDAS